MTNVMTGNRDRTLVHDDHISILWTTDLPVAMYLRPIHQTILHFHGRLVFHWSLNSIGRCTEADPTMVHQSVQCIG